MNKDIYLLFFYSFFLGFLSIYLTFLNFTFHSLSITSGSDATPVGMPCFCDTATAEYRAATTNHIGLTGGGKRERCLGSESAGTMLIAGGQQ